MIYPVPLWLMITCTTLTFAAIFAAIANLFSGYVSKGRSLRMVQVAMIATLAMFFSVEAIISLSCFFKLEMRIGLIIRLSVVAMFLLSTTIIFYYFGFYRYGFAKMIKDAKPNL